MRAKFLLMEVMSLLLAGDALSAPVAHSKLNEDVSFLQVIEARHLLVAHALRSSAVKVRGVVTSPSGWKNSYFLQDASGGISIDRSDQTPVAIGDTVEVTGDVLPGQFAPVLHSAYTRVIDHGRVPTAPLVKYSDIALGSFDSQQIQIEGVVHMARVERIWGRLVILLDLHVAGGIVTVHLLSTPSYDISGLVDSTVRISGVCGSIFNDRRQLVGLRLFVPNASQIQVIEPRRELELIPVTPVGALMQFDGPRMDHLVHLRAVVTYQRDGVIFLQEGRAGVRVHALLSSEIGLGSVVDAWGFFSNADYALNLENVVIRKSPNPISVRPVRIDASDVIKIEDGFHQAHHDSTLVEIEGLIVERLPSSRKQLWEIRSGDVVFQAELSGFTASRLIELAPGMKVTFTGVCVAEADENGNFRAFRILLRTPQDIRVLSRRDWTAALVVPAMMFLFVIGGSFIVWLAHRRSYTPLIEDEDSKRLRHNFRKLSISLAALAFGSGSVILCATWAGSERAFSLFGTRPNAAVGFILEGLALVLLTRKGSRIFRLFGGITSWAVVMLGTITLLEFMTGWNLGIDTLLIISPVSVPSNLPNYRMAIGTAFCLAVLGVATKLIDKRRLAGLSQVLSLSVAVLSTMNLVSYLYGYDVNFGQAGQATMPQATAVSLLLLSLAILFRSPEYGPMKTICASSPGGVMARRVLPAALIFPLLLGWIRLQGQIAGMYDTRFGLTLYAITNIVTFGFVIWSSAALLNRLERKRSETERSLRERDNKLAMVFDSGLIGDFTWDVEADEVTARSGVWKLYGDPNHQGKAYASWFRERQHPQDREGIERALKTAIDAKIPFDIEFRVIWPDDSIHWVGCRGTPAFGPDGKLLQVNGLNIDVTDRKNAELRLRKSEILFRELADAMPQIVWTSDAEGNTSYYNRRWYDYTGLQVGADPGSHIHADDQSDASREWARCFEKGLPYQFELRLLRGADSTYRWHLARAVPVYNDAGKVERWFGTSTDIDDFKRASAGLEDLNESLEQRVQERSHQLAESERRFRLLVENVTEYAIFMLNDRGQVSTWNAGAMRIYGYQPVEILGHDFSIFYQQDCIQLGQPARELASAAGSGEFRDDGWRVRKDGSLFWASALVTAIHSSDGKVVAFSKIVRDLTEQKLWEQRLLVAQHRAEDANRAKSGVLATMSHEIRTPMNAILGMADLLWETDLDPVQRDYVGRFRRAGSNLLTLLNDILDLSKIESGSFELERVDFNLNELLDRTNELLGPRATSKTIGLEMRVAPETPDILVGDPGRLQQTLINLIGNAIKFTTKGHVTLKICPHQDQTTGHIQFSVHDTGIGIAEDKLSMIFEDFTQAESSTTRKFGGTGLGLGICRRLVERMGGRLTVDSVEGTGSTFSFDAYFGIGEKTCRYQNDSKDPENVRVLVADDNATNRLIIVEMCAGWDIATEEASSLEEAEKKLAASLRDGLPFSLIVLDQVMPGVKRFEALQSLRALDSAIPIIVTSSDNQPGDTTMARTLGVTSYLMKPIRRSELRAAIFQAARPVDEQPGPRKQAVSFEISQLMTILVAEDSEDNRFLVQAYLRGEPYKLTFAHDGSEAFRLFKTSQFDLVLMDVQMPVMDGLKAAACIRDFEREQSWRMTPIIALTANALTDDVELSHAAGCNAHLSKPVTKSRLVDAIEKFRASSHVAAADTDIKLVEVPPHEFNIPEGLESLSRDYIEARRVEIKQMGDLLATKDLAALRRIGHNVKGTGASFGFPELTSLGNAIEQAAKTADLELLGHQLTEMGAYVEFACAKNKIVGTYLQR